MPFPRRSKVATGTTDRARATKAPRQGDTTYRTITKAQSHRLLERAAQLGFEPSGVTPRATSTSVSSTLASLVAAIGQECLGSHPSPHLVSGRGTAGRPAEGDGTVRQSLGHSSLSFGSSAESALLGLIRQHEEELRGLSGWDRMWEESQEARVDAATRALGKLRLHSEDTPLSSQRGSVKRRRPAAAAAAAAGVEQSRDSRARRVEEGTDMPLRARASTGPSVLPDAAVRTLMQWFVNHLEHPYPAAAEKKALQQETGLSREQIRNYMTNLRKRHWHPLCRGRPPRNAMEEHLLQSAKKQGIL